MTGSLAALGYESDDQRLIVSGLSELCERHMTEEYLGHCDAEGAYPHEFMNRLAAAGWAGLAVGEEFGGSGGSASDLAVAHRTLARFGLAPAQASFSLWVLGAEAISRLGSTTQRENWLPPLAKGAVKVAFALTEPDSGSDAAALRTRAEFQGDDLVVNGQKVFITGAAVADTIITAVRTSPPGPAGRGISLVMIDPRSEGVTIRKLTKIGLRSIDLCEVFLDDVRVPVDCVLGPVDGGWESMRAGLASERMLLAAICVGATAQIIDLCVTHAGDRRAFGQPIGSFQLVASLIVRMRVAMDAADLLVARAAAAIDEGRPDAATLSSIAKLHATEAYVSAARDGVQVFGGYGYVDDSPIARHYRDAKYMEIGGGTSQIQTMIIAKAMGLG